MVGFPSLPSIHMPALAICCHPQGYGARQEMTQGRGKKTPGKQALFYK
jgi:hypothetical protein